MTKPKSPDQLLRQPRAGDYIQPGILLPKATWESCKAKADQEGVSVSLLISRLLQTALEPSE
jgi:hypothetical protein